MVTVKIPDNAHPWRCSINGTEYCYEAGSTQSVPDEVAQLIHDIEAAAKQPAPVDPPFPVPEGGSSLPEYTDDDAGKVLSVNEDGDGVEWAEAGGGGGGGGDSAFRTLESVNGGSFVWGEWSGHGEIEGVYTFTVSVLDAELAAFSGSVTINGDTFDATLAVGYEPTTIGSGVSAILTIDENDKYVLGVRLINGAEEDPLPVASVTGELYTISDKLNALFNMW